MADQNSGQSDEALPPSLSFDLEPQAERREAMLERFMNTASYLALDFRGIDFRETASEGGGRRGQGSGGGGGQPVTPSPISRHLQSKRADTPAMLGRKSKSTGKGSAGKTSGDAGGSRKELKPLKYRKLASDNLKPCLLLRDQSGDWFKKRKLEAWIQAMKANRKPSEPPPQTPDVPSTRPPNKPKSGV